MDPLAHITQKTVVDRARQAQQQPIPETAPPPYTATSDTSATSSDPEDSDASDDDDESSETPTTLTINCPSTIRGNANLVPTSPSALSDATKFSALLLHAVNRINASGGGRGMSVNLTINCGTTVIGDRNVVGNICLKHKGAGQGGVAVGPGAVAPPRAEEEGVVGVGAKRKAEEQMQDAHQRPSKRRSPSAEPGAWTSSWHQVDTVLGEEAASQQLPSTNGSGRECVSRW